MKTEQISALAAATVEGERKAFEAWMRSVPGHQSLAKEYMNETSGRYDSPYTNLMWSAWNARAALGK